MTSELPEAPSAEASKFVSILLSHFEREWVPRVAVWVAERMCGEDGADGSHDASHLVRVWWNAQKIGERERDRTGASIDWDVLAAICLTHDNAVVDKSSAEERQTAAGRSADAAVPILGATEAFDSDQLALADDAIRCHSFSSQGEPESLEGAILRDADRLDALGAVGIARTFHTGGGMESELYHPTDPFGNDRPLEDDAYVVDHFYQKLLRLKDNMLTQSAAALAERRHRLMEQFLDQLANEIGSAGPDSDQPSYDENGE
jgi:uncharacterized protein